MTSTATIKGGRSLVSTKGKGGAKQNWHVLVPYTTEEPSPAAQAADVARVAADVIADLVATVPCTSSSPSEAQAFLAVARKAAEAAQRHVAPSERSPGFNADAKAIEEAVKKVAEAAQSTLAWVTTNLIEVQRSAAATATMQAMHHCQKVAQELPFTCAVPANPAPPSICTLVEVEHLVKWQQERDGRSLTHRLAVGLMKPLNPVTNMLLRFDTKYCDGSRGRRKRVPTMFSLPAGEAGYKYAVFLDQIECAMVKATDVSGNNFFIPVNKMSTKG
jgi:hypothetical protein